MEKKEVDLSIPYEAEKRKNKYAIAGVGLMNGIIAISYIFEVVKGKFSIGSYIILALLCIVPTVWSVILYHNRKDSPLIRHVNAVGFLLMYADTMFTRSTNLVFAYVILVYVMLIIYSDLKMSIRMGVCAVLINIAAVVQCALTGNMDSRNFTESEIMILCMLLTCVFAILAVDTINKINKANMDKTIAEKSQTQHMLDTVLGVSDSMASDVEKTRHEMKELEVSIMTTKSAMENLAQGTGESAEAIQLQQENTERISRHIAKVNEVTHLITNEVNKVETNLSDGQKVMKNLLEHINDSSKINSQVAGNVDELKDYTSIMKTILDMINNVADQTELLALNASIEAARAGEAGKGFAVVAGEISTLANQTSSATGDINELINNISKSLMDTVSAIDSLFESNKMQNDYINETAKQLGTIYDSTEEVMKEADNLKNVVENVTQANRTISESISNVSALTEEVMASANDTLDTSVANIENVSIISDIVENLSLNAQELKNIQTN